MVERNFDAEYQEQYGDLQGHSFVLGGHEFHTKALAPPKAFRDREQGLDAAITFIMRVLVPEDREIFEKMIDDEDVKIAPFQLDQIGSWLIEVTSGRPTESPAGSGSGDAPTST